MGKRIGANQRKKIGQRRGKRRRVIPVFLPAIICGIAAAAGAAFLINRNEQWAGTVATALARLRQNTIVTNIALQGAVQVKLEEILRRSGMKLPVPLNRLRSEYLDKFSEVTPWIQKARLIKVRQGTATIAIIERKPVAMMQAGRIVLVDAEGVYMPLDNGASLDLPLVSGLRDSTGAGGTRRLTGTECGRMNRFFSAAAPFDSTLGRRITQVNFRPDRTVRVMLAGSAAVITLDEKNITDRLGRLVQVWETLQSDPLPPARIDLSYRNLAFVTTAAAGMAQQSQTGKKNRG
jgi:cell division septal protein FtsQ